MNRILLNHKDLEVLGTSLLAAGDDLVTQDVRQAIMVARRAGVIFFNPDVLRAIPGLEEITDNVALERFSFLDPSLEKPVRIVYAMSTGVVGENDDVEPAVSLGELAQQAICGVDEDRPLAFGFQRDTPRSIAGFQTFLLICRSLSAKYRIGLKDVFCLLQSLNVDSPAVREVVSFFNMACELDSALDARQFFAHSGHPFRRFVSSLSYWLEIQDSLRSFRVIPEQRIAQSWVNESMALLLESQVQKLLDRVVPAKREANLALAVAELHSACLSFDRSSTERSVQIANLVESNAQIPGTSAHVLVRLAGQRPALSRVLSSRGLASLEIFTPGAAAYQKSPSMRLRHAGCPHHESDEGRSLLLQEILRQSLREFFRNDAYTDFTVQERFYDALARLTLAQLEQWMFDVRAIPVPSKLIESSTAAWLLDRGVLDDQLTPLFRARVKYN